MWIQNSSSLPPLPVGGLAQCGASWEKSTILPQFFSESNKVSRVYLVSYILLFYSIMDAKAAENVLVDLDQELEHIRGFICGCRCFDDGPCCQQFMDWEIVDTPNECKGDNS